MSPLVRTTWPNHIKTPGQFEVSVGDGLMLGDSPATGTAEFQNAPGWTEILNTSFPTSGDAEASPPSPWSWITRNNPGEFTFSSDATGPLSPNGALDVVYAGNQENQGDAPGAYYTSIGTVNRVYMAIWFKFDPNWEAHSSGVNKIFPVKTNGTTLSWVSLRTDWWSGTGTGSGSPPPGSGVGGYIFVQEEGGGGNAGGDDNGGYFPQNDNVVQYNWGDWMKVEVLRDRTGGTGSGTLTLWLNDTRVTHYTDMNHDDQWVEALLEPTWGGGAGDTPSQDIYVRYDHVLVEAQ